MECHTYIYTINRYNCHKLTFNMYGFCGGLEYVYNDVQMIQTL